MAAIEPIPSTLPLSEQLRIADARIRRLTAERDALRAELAAEFRKLQQRLERIA